MKHPRRSSNANAAKPRNITVPDRCLLSLWMAHDAITTARALAQCKGDAWVQLLLQIERGIAMLQQEAADIAESWEPR